MFEVENVGDTSISQDAKNEATDSCDLGNESSKIILKAINVQGSDLEAADSSEDVPTSS
jgi:hypothetical protein